METPWGYADHVETFCNGIVSVDTPTHGGLFVPPNLIYKIPEEERNFAKKWSGSEYWYEEDLCAASVYHAFPDINIRNTAPHILNRWYNFLRDCL